MNSLPPADDEKPGEENGADNGSEKPGKKDEKVPPEPPETKPGGKKPGFVLPDTSGSTGRHGLLAALALAAWQLLEWRRTGGGRKRERRGQP